MPRRSSARPRPAPARAPAHRPAPAPAPAQPVNVPVSPGSGIFGQMAATAAGVAVGSAVGHALGNSLMSGSSEVPVQQPVSGQAALNQQPLQKPCEFEMIQFLECAKNNDLNMCEGYNQILKECRSRYNL